MIGHSPMFGLDDSNSTIGPPAWEANLDDAIPSLEVAVFFLLHQLSQ